MTTLSPRSSLYVWAMKDIPQDLRDALADAAGRETSVPGQRVLSTILRNVAVAARKSTTRALAKTGCVGE